MRLIKLSSLEGEGPIKHVGLDGGWYSLLIQSAERPNKSESRVGRPSNWGPHRQPDIAISLTVRKSVYMYDTISNATRSRAGLRTVQLSIDSNLAAPSHETLANLSW